MSLFIVDDLLINLILLKSNSPIPQGNFLEKISQLNLNNLNRKVHLRHIYSTAHLHIHLGALLGFFARTCCGKIPRNRSWVLQ